NARETAVRRCEMMGGMVILGSATPSMESRFLADKGIYKRALLTVRGNASAVLPRTILVDMRQELKNKNRSILSKVLHEKIQERLDKKEQIMLFVNRRGYSNCISCRSCGKAVMCPHCDISLTLHSDGTLKCHYCGYKTPVMDECPSCGSPYLAGLGFGTEKAVELVAKEFPSARIIRMDMDSTSKAGSHEEILKTFANGEADILLGTQMIVKGHDFSNVTLVGVLIADKSLYASTYKAAEKTFQLLTQAAGRAGRGELPGEVVIQTYRPDHFAIECACLQDYEGFYAREIRYRRSMDYPPVSRMLSILVTSVIEKNAEDAAVKTAEKIRQMKGLTVTGPAPDTIGRINDSYRRMIFVRSKDIDALISLLEKLTDKKYIAGYENVNIECVLT
ncbi:MAG: primosomal protein N', partial [Lachnospiraceae bacterium]|nr:primosomal protein N' [Lachnospiraceae bacterium]